MIVTKRRICSITNVNMRFHSAFWQKDWRTKGRLLTSLRRYPHVESPERSVRTSEMQGATFPSHLPPSASFCDWSFVKDAVPCDARGAGSSSCRTTRISHEGFGTPWGPPARSLGRSTCCSTLSTTGRNCSHPADSNTFSCSSALKQPICHSESFIWLPKIFPHASKSYNEHCFYFDICLVLHLATIA